MNCTVIISATGDRCGRPAVDVRESLFGDTIAECEGHHTPRMTAVPETAVGRRVEISWHSWPKPGVVKVERAKTVDVEFVPRAGAQAIVRTFSKADVRGL